MKKFRQFVLAAAIIGWVLTTATAAESLSVLLQKGIFAEETEGNLDAAIKIYQQITAEAATNRSVVAQAQYRLGVCYRKKGNKEQAISILNDLLKQFPDEAVLGQKARELLAGLGQAPASNITMRRVLTDAAGIGDVLTADGKYICRISGGTGDVVQYEIASGRTSRITNREPWSGKGETLGVPAFSRDGKQIAYDWYSEDLVAQVRVRNLDGSGLRTLYSQKEHLVVPLDWSPDGASILAFREGHKADELMLISTADGSVRVLRAVPGADWRLIRNAGFSPDGQWLAFSALRGGSPPQGDVFLMTADGRNEAVVAGHPAMDEFLGWSSDGRSLVFLSDRSGTWDIWTAHITGGKQQGEPELLKKDFGSDAEVLGFAPGDSFYYKTVTSAGRLYHGELDLETGKVLVPPAPVTTRYTGMPVMVTWSPDGTKLLYISNWGFGPGKDILTIRSTATGEERFLSGLGFVNQISWAPDGRSVIALGGAAGTIRIDIETSEITKLADGGLFPKLCPDGKTLVFASGPIIKKRNLDTGEESEVVDEGTGGTAQWLYDLSPDGREVVFQAKDAIKTVSLNGGEPRELFRGPAKRYRLRWTRDGRYVIAHAANFAGQGDATDAVSTAIWRIPAQGGTPLKLDLTVPKLDFFALHPDNRRFAYSVYAKTKSELWVMEGLMPKPAAQADGMVTPSAAQETTAADKQAETNGKSDPLKGIPPRDPATKPNLVDLSDFYNGSLTQGWLPSTRIGKTSDKTLPLPLGRGKFDGVEFDVRGLIQLTGLSMKKNGGVFPEEAKGIKVGSKCKRLHFLQSAVWGQAVEKGTQIGAYVAHYVDGSQQEIRIVRGEDIDDWMVYEVPTQELKRASIAWTGENPAGMNLRVYKTTWENPLPDVEIRAIDYVSKMTDASPFLIAISVE